VGTAVQGQPILGEVEEGGGRSLDNLKKIGDNLKKIGDNSKKIGDNLNLNSKKIGDNLNLNSGMKTCVLNGKRWNRVNRNNYLSMSPEGPFRSTIKSN